MRRLAWSHLRFRSARFIAVLCGMLLATTAFLGISERAAELAAIRAFGWREMALGRLIVTEGVVIGLSGSLAGAGVGLYAAAKFAGQLPGTLYVLAGVAVTGGVLVTAAAALLPAQALRRLPTAQLLAEE